MLNAFLLFVPALVVTAAALFYAARSATGQDSGQSKIVPDHSQDWEGSWGRGRDVRPRDETWGAQGPRRRGGPPPRTSAPQPPRPGEEQQECVLCCDKPWNARLLPCRHENVCLDCVEKIFSMGDGNCPFCREPIFNYVKVSRKYPE